MQNKEQIDLIVKKLSEALAISKALKNVNREKLTEARAMILYSQKKFNQIKEDSNEETSNISHT